ncbi:uncharacterized protein LOC116613349 [Nematostella vectensis]|uniref:uncharacterized protein LOC116613349 n=1 Tax=Nematostella vectensis TaxID=45351 RepID=UPI00207799A0|nr:uncharacterized protein LOC116613349 [Nematostella vectensis]
MNLPKLLIVFSPFLFLSMYTNSEFQFMNFMEKSGHALVGFVIETSNTADELKCKLKCLVVDGCKSVNIGKRNGDEPLFTCEVNNSTHLEQPLALRRRARFAYHGFADPCFSGPCLNGGSCTSDHSSWTYRCTCGLEIKEAPFLNDHCAIDPQMLQTSAGIFSNVFDVSGYKSRLLSFSEAERACQAFGARMASREELIEAWENGYHLCRWGWLSDVSRGIPIQRPSSNCGGADGVPGVYILITHEAKTFEAHCYREIDACNEEDWSVNGHKCYRFVLDRRVSWSEAARFCHVLDASLASAETLEKLRFVRRHVMMRSNVTDIFIGLQQIDGQWGWLNSTDTVSAILWNETAPRSQGTVGAVLIETGRLVDIPDGEELPFVCEKALP